MFCNLYRFLFKSVYFITHYQQYHSNRVPLECELSYPQMKHYIRRCVIEATITAQITFSVKRYIYGLV